MADSYPIVQVRPEWVLEQEDMGTKEKFWYRRPSEDESDWLFKHPRQGGDSCGSRLKDNGKGAWLRLSTTLLRWGGKCLTKGAFSC